MFTNRPLPLSQSALNLAAVASNLPIVEPSNSRANGRLAEPVLESLAPATSLPRRTLPKQAPGANDPCSISNILNLASREPCASSLALGDRKNRGGKAHRCPWLSTHLVSQPSTRLTPQQSSLNWLPIVFNTIPIHAKKEHEKLTEAKDHPALSSQPLGGLWVEGVTEQQSAHLIPSTIEPDVKLSMALGPLEWPQVQSIQSSEPIACPAPNPATDWLRDLVSSTSLCPSLDPFPSPLPSRRFLETSALDSFSPQEVSLPAWVVQEYLRSSSTKLAPKLDASEDAGRAPTPARHRQPIWTAEKRADNVLITSEAGSESSSSVSATTPSRRPRKSRRSTSSASNLLLQASPSPGKVFYALLDQAQVEQFNSSIPPHPVVLANGIATSLPKQAPPLEPLPRSSERLTKSRMAKFRQFFLWDKKKAKKKWTLSTPEYLLSA